MHFCGHAWQAWNDERRGKIPKDKAPPTFRRAVNGLWWLVEGEKDRFGRKVRKLDSDGDEAGRKLWTKIQDRRRARERSGHDAASLVTLCDAGEGEPFDQQYEIARQAAKLAQKFGIEKKNPPEHGRSGGSALTNDSPVEESHASVGGDRSTVNPMSSKSETA